MKKEILITILAGMLVSVCVYGATYKNISPTNTPDIEKTIEKAWTEERTLSFIPQLRISELENMKAGIDGQIASYNKLQAELAEAVSTLNLIIEIPNKLIFK